MIYLVYLNPFFGDKGNYFPQMHVIVVRVVLWLTGVRQLEGSLKADFGPSERGIKGVSRKKETHNTSFMFFFFFFSVNEDRL